MCLISVIHNKNVNHQTFKNVYVSFSSSFLTTLHAVPYNFLKFLATFSSPKNPMMELLPVCSSVQFSGFDKQQNRTHGDSLVHSLSISGRTTTIKEHITNNFIVFAMLFLSTAFLRVSHSNARALNLIVIHVLSFIYTYMIIHPLKPIGQ